MNAKLGEKKERKVSTAVVLSLLVPGLGQLYCGALMKCLVIVAISSLLMTVAIGVAGVSPGLGGASLIFYLVGIVAVMAWAAWDAARLARRAGESYLLQECNRWWVYVVMLILGGGASSVVPALEIRREHLHAFKVPERSMYPAILPGDQILAIKSAYRDEDPDRGDLIVFYKPGDRKRHFVKRVVAVAGDRIAMDKGVLFLNGERVTGEQAVPGSDGKGEGELYQEVIDGRSFDVFWGQGTKGAELGSFDEIVVPPYSVFVLGDNRGKSLDSRSFGIVPVIGVVGEVGFLYFPGDWDFGRPGSMRDED